MVTKFFLFLLALQIPVNALFSTGFTEFLKTNYGSKIANQLGRADLSPTASYGGGNKSDYMLLNHDAVILVHGAKSCADFLVSIRDFFESNGFEKGSVFATSFGPIGRRIEINDSLLCEYVNQIRILIEAVNLYTRRKISIATYSTGTAVSRKAILGGKCVENNQNLGKSYTSIVSRFLSVAGVSQGLEYCNTLWNGSEFCNNITGTVSSSQFLQDINKKQHYEGDKIYVIRSIDDHVVGYDNIFISGTDINVKLTGFKHVQTILFTTNSQAELIRTGRLTEKTLSVDLAAARKELGINCSGTVEYNHSERKKIGVVILIGSFFMMLMTLDNKLC